MSANKMARYMMMARTRESGRDNRGGNYGARNEYERIDGGNYGARNEGGDYGRGEMNYDMDSRFRDRRGREHYDNGRFAPMRGNYDVENRGNEGGGNRSAESIMPWYNAPENRRGGARNEYGMERRGGRENGGRREMRSEYDDDDEGGMRMNVIGFDRPQEMQSHYPTRIDYHHGDEMEHRSGEWEKGGAMGEDMRMDREMAEKWVSQMKNEDGSTGGRWKVDQVKALLSQKSMDRDPWEIYAVMNALYSDYGKVLKKRGITTADAYLDMALAFINDKDAVPNKAAMYYEYIVKH